MNISKTLHSQFANASFLMTFSFVLCMGFSLRAQTSKEKVLFDPSKPQDWYIFLDKDGKNNDSLHVFRFEGNTVHVSGQRFGYIVTQESFRDFRLVLEFKWGERRWPPRDTVKRDAGVLYNIPEGTTDKVWPRGIEFQIQQGDCGDFWMIDSTTISHVDSVTTPTDYRRAQKFRDAEKPKGEWNVVEVRSRNGELTHYMNGVLVNQGKNPSSREGRILLQSEGAEIYYRNVRIERL